MAYETLAISAEHEKEIGPDIKVGDSVRVLPCDPARDRCNIGPGWGGAMTQLIGEVGKVIEITRLGYYKVHFTGQVYFTGRHRHHTNSYTYSYIRSWIMLEPSEPKPKESEARVRGRLLNLE